MPTANPIDQVRALVADILRDSTAPQACTLDLDQWLAMWLNTRIPALGGKRPAELIGTLQGLGAVLRVLEASSSGAFQ